jgi:hypothetical protein
MITESQSPRNGNDNYFLFLLSIAVVAIVLLCFKVFNLSHELGHEQRISSVLLTDISALQDSIRSNKHIVDTLYLQKVSIQVKYRDKIVLISQLDSVQHDSLFGLIYPSKDSANRTFYHYQHASEQLVLSDSIIVVKDSIISDLETIISNKDTLLIQANKDLANEKKSTKKAYRKGLLQGGALGFILGLLIP